MKYLLALITLVPLFCGAQQVPEMLNPLRFPGADIGAKINAALLSCSGACSVEIPQGVYALATTIDIPVATGGGMTLECASQSTTLKYTGAGDAIAAFGSGQNRAGILIKNCSLDGSSATGDANGLHVIDFGGMAVDHIRISNFPGNGILNEGVNTVTYLAPDIEGNYVNLHNTGSNKGYSANTNKVLGGIIGYAKTWGVFEDGSMASIAFPNGGNVYLGVNFENNGTSGETSGNAFFQGCDGCVIQDSYLEYLPRATQHIPYNIVIGGHSDDGIGDLTASPQGVKIIDNHLISDNATTAVAVMGGRMVIVDGNSEVGNPVNFIDFESSDQASYIGHNIALAAAHYLIGNNPNPTTGVSAGSGPSENGVVSYGYGFNVLTGDTSDLTVRTREGGTNNLIGLNSSGSQIYWIDNVGVGHFTGIYVDDNGLVFNTPVSRIATVGGNNMVTGTVNVKGTSFGITMFPGSYNYPPNCQITPRQDTGSVHYWVSASPTSVTVWTSQSYTGSFNYFCAGDAN